MKKKIKQHFFFALSHLTFRPWTNLVQQPGRGSFPDSENLCPQLPIAVVNVAVRLNVQRGADQREQRGIEIDRGVVVQRHVHGDQALQGEEEISKIR